MAGNGGCILTTVQASCDHRNFRAIEGCEQVNQGAPTGTAYIDIAYYNPLGYTTAVQTVVELPLFTKQAATIFSPAEKDAVIDYLALHPLSGDEIPGTGGVRKVRFGAKGKGKSGGARVIYYWYSEDAPVFAMLVYGKNEKTDLKPAEAKIVAAMARDIKSQHRRRRHD